MKYYRRILVSTFLLTVIAFVFWQQSRLPDLTEKVHLGPHTTVAAIGFRTILPVPEQLPFYKRVAFTSVNWIYTNWEGMTFGLLFAAGCLTLLKCFPRQAYTHPILDTVKGVILGVPLSICVNCSTPIALSMHRAGIRLETALATLTSSPTLNIIVLSMTFSLLPFHYALIKLLSVVIFIFVTIPILVRLLYRYNEGKAIGQMDIDDLMNDLDEEETAMEPNPICELEIAGISTSEPWIDVIAGTFRSYSREFLYVVQITLPFMLLAGFLGALMVESLPLEGFRDLSMSIPGLLLVAVVGTFLPVPIAFDVIIVSILISNGLAPSFAMALLFTLGIFSIYPFLIIWRNISPRIAGALFATTIIIGLVSGLGIDAYEKQLASRAPVLEDLSMTSLSDRPDGLSIAE